MDKDRIMGTCAAGHWLYGNKPESHTELKREVERLQKTLSALIAVGAVSERRAECAYALSQPEPQP